LAYLSHPIPRWFEEVDEGHRDLVIKMRRRNGNALVCELIMALGFITATVCCIAMISEIRRD
jgi:hypothetical protein